MGEQDDVFYWGHLGLHNPQLLHRDGVHFRHQSMQSVQGAVTTYLHR